MSQKPDKELADKLLNEIKKSGLINERYLDKLKLGYEKGNLTAEDWKLFINDDNGDDDDKKN